MQLPNKITVCNVLASIPTCEIKILKSVVLATKYFVDKFFGTKNFFLKLTLRPLLYQNLLY